MFSEITVSIDDTDISSISELEGIVSPMDYIVLLNNRKLDDDAADVEIMLFLFKLYDIRQRLQLEFSVTAEMRREKNKGLIFLKTPTDFVIASNISSMIIAQVANNPRIRFLFNELLSNKGNEIYLRYASSLGCDGESIAIKDLRQIALDYGYLILGYIKGKSGKEEIVMNPDAWKKVKLDPEDRLIVLGKT